MSDNTRITIILSNCKELSLAKKVPSIVFTEATKITDLCSALSVGCFYYSPESTFIITDTVDGEVDIIGKFDEWNRILTLNREIVCNGSTIYRDPISGKISFTKRVIN